MHSIIEQQMCWQLLVNYGFMLNRLRMRECFKSLVVIYSNYHTCVAAENVPNHECDDSVSITSRLCCLLTLQRNVTSRSFQEVDEENIEETAPEPSSSRSELSILNSKFEEFKKSRDLTLTKVDQLDLTETTKHSSPLCTSRSTSRLPSRPSL